MGAERLHLIAGPVDLGPGLFKRLEALRDAGADLVWSRSGDFRDLVQAGKEVGIPVGAEIQDVRSLPDFLDLDLILVSADRVQDRVLLEELGKCELPVLLRRGKGSTVEELVQAARVLEVPILCESGIRWAEEILDLSAIPALHRLSSCPVAAEPGKWGEPMALAAVAAGADLVLLPPESFLETTGKLRRLRAVLDSTGGE